MKKMVSIIIPTYNESKNVLPLLKNLLNLKGEFEMIFVDAGEDDTFEKIPEQKNITKIKSEKGRAKQMNAGAKIAKGKYFWFLHADSKVNPYSITAIKKSNAEVGCFKLKFDDNSFLLKIISTFTNIRGKIMNLAFGDRGVFVKKDLFFSLGGFTEIPLMEDYDFSYKIHRANKVFKVLNLQIITSARRFKKNGTIKTILLMKKLQHDFRLNKNIWKIYYEYEK
ncbi:MAG: TIGR04283 family arsenosugar biosynthesis glycosyltransferase [Treponemataceae bacterium]